MREAGLGNRANIHSTLSVTPVILKPRRPQLQRICFSFCVIVLIAAIAPAAWARELHVRSFDAQIDVLNDSSVDVTENIRVQFIGAWQGLYRTIPVEYPGPGGFNYTLFLTDINATNGSDGESAPLRIEKHRQGADLELKIYVPNAANATKTIALHYRVRNGLRFFPDHDELYWNVTGTQWTVPIDAASANITFPQGVT